MTSRPPICSGIMTALKFMIHPTAARFLGGLIALACGTTAMAVVFDMRGLELDFTKPDVVRQASWTQSEFLKLGPHGLIHETSGPSIDFQLQTTEPFAIGLSWQPARSAAISATLSPVASPITLDNGQTYTPSPGRMFVRYSPDTKHWSTWQVLATPSTEPTGYTFSGELVVSKQDYGAFDELCGKLRREGIHGEEACAQRILESDPDFFAKHLPFIGYVQFLYEANLADVQRIEHLNIYIRYGFSFHGGPGALVPA